MTDEAKPLKTQLQELIQEAETFFKLAESRLEATGDGTNWRPFSMPSNWDVLPNEVKEASDGLRERLLKLGVAILDASKSSPLLGPADAKDIRLCLRGMSSALRLNKFEHHDTYAITEEDRVYGMIPEDQSEQRTDVDTASKQFQRASRDLLGRLDFIVPTPEGFSRAIVASEPASVRKYRPNTAFIMMQIDSSNPHLDDVKWCIKDVFKGFGIDAVRSDEIEHQDVLTQRILDEIATSEFLIADLTGERPSVYYEVGFAHACGKRPILYREKGTRLHFDLSVHNVPEYENITDLKGKLTKRLEAITNKSGG